MMSLSGQVCVLRGSVVGVCVLRGSVVGVCVTGECSRCVCYGGV